MDVHLPHDLLESNHVFPGLYQIKAIGDADKDFEDQVLKAIEAELTDGSAIDVSVRTTTGGRYLSITLNVMVQSPAQVNAIYRRIQVIDGLRFLL